MLGFDRENALNLRQAVFISGLMVVLAACHLLVFDRANARLDRTMASIVAADRSAAQLRRGCVGLEQMNQQVADLGSAVELFESKLSQPRDIDQMLADLSQMAAADSLQFTASKSGANASGFPKFSIPGRDAVLTLNGDFNGFYSFLLQLEKRSTSIHITTLIVDRLDGRDGEMIAKVGVQLFSGSEHGDLLNVSRNLRASR